MSSLASGWLQSKGVVGWLGIILFTGKSNYSIDQSILSIKLGDNCLEFDYINGTAVITSTQEDIAGGKWMWN